MRIISGKYKGRTIPVRKNFPSRPTTDFAKENLFNVLGNYFDFDELEVLDLFSGTGSISYEFASRECGRVVSVEKDYRSYGFIRSTISELKLTGISPVKMDAFKFIEKCDEKFDIVFADPPYDLINLAELPEKVLQANILKENGWFVLEHGKKHQFNDNQHIKDNRTYGSVHFSIFKP
jgi:16S rRNA (guanine(966)-N(2))-methyltransferase RsmD